ncbi:MAG: tetratricopeptide repeat protein, partial [Crenarchaeota archaeon]|nr:tetratricopeptide repeat protein [Thermoproteota archaeon]
CLAEAGKYQEAADFYREVFTEPEQESLEVISNIASVFAKAGLNAEALKYYQIGLAKYPEDAALLNNYALTLETAGRITEALNYYTQALLKEPANPVFLQNKAFCLEKLHREPEAMECLDQILRQEPLNRSAWDFKGALFLRQGRPDLAIDCYNLAWGLCHYPQEALFGSGAKFASMK